MPSGRTSGTYRYFHGDNLMSWSYRIARVAGVDIKIHITFFLIVFLGAFQWGLERGVSGALFGATLILLLFACVTLHELGHSIVARYFRVPVREIILLPIGGIAFFEKQPEKPLHELLIAAAGPVVNVILAGLITILLGATVDVALLNEQGMVVGEEMTLSLTTLLLWLLAANVMLVLFNLLPAFPLDGGRMLRALLAMFFGQTRATSIASTIGQAIAIFLGVFGVITGNIILALVAVFIFFGASQENRESYARTVLHTRRVGDAYNKYVLTLAIGDRVNKVIDYILTSYQPDFAVMQGQKLLGVVTRDDVLKALNAPTADASVPDTYVQMIMRRDVVRVDATMMLDEVRQVMSEKGERVVAVYEGETYLGLVSIEDIAEAFSVLLYLDRASSKKQAEPEPG